MQKGPQDGRENRSQPDIFSQRRMDFDPYFHMHDLYFRREIGPGNQDIGNMMMQNPRFRPPVGTLFKIIVHDTIFCLPMIYINSYVASVFSENFYMDPAYPGGYSPFNNPMANHNAFMNAQKQNQIHRPPHAQSKSSGNIVVNHYNRMFLKIVIQDES